VDIDDESVAPRYDPRMKARALGAALLTACASATPPPTTSATTSTAASATTTSAAPASTGAPLPDLLLPSEPTSGPSGPVSTSPNPTPPPKSEQPACGNDQDCWSITCCPATSADDCVHHSLAQKCAVVDVTCAKSETHVDCACDKGVCTGRAP
jgi:hypothetical protein